MDTSLKGHSLPGCAEEAAQLEKEGRLKFLTCGECGTSLAIPGAAHTYAGWRETQITGTCEDCFDKLFEEDDGCPND